MSVTAPGLGPDRRISLAACFLNWVPNGSPLARWPACPGHSSLVRAAWHSGQECGLWNLTVCVGNLAPLLRRDVTLSKLLGFSRAQSLHQ